MGTVGGQLESRSLRLAAPATGAESEAGGVAAAFVGRFGVGWAALPSSGALAVGGTALRSWIRALVEACISWAAAIREIACIVSANTPTTRAMTAMKLVFRTNLVVSLASRASFFASSSAPLKALWTPGTGGLSAFSKYEVVLVRWTVRGRN